MRVKGVIADDFVNYKFPSMFINTCFCDFKCCKEAGLDINVCQNAQLVNKGIREISDSALYGHYTRNPISRAIVIGGMEPFFQYGELANLIKYFREHGDDSDIVIYTGYNKDELDAEIKALSKFPNIVIKFGRYIPGQSAHYDDVLGVYLASDNQYAERIS